MIKKRIFVFISIVMLHFSYGKNIEKDSLLTNSKKKTHHNQQKFAAIDAQIAFKEAFNTPVTRSYNPTNYLFSSTNDSIKSKLQRLFTKEDLKFVEKISGNELVELPIGLKGHTSDGFQAELVIVKAKITEHYIELTAFARLQTQFDGIQLYFAAEGLKLSRDGGVIGNWKLHLIGKQSLPQLGGKMLLTLIGSEIKQTSGGFVDNSSIEFDCNGFKSFAFKADIRMSRSLVVPLDTEGKRIVYDKDLSDDGYQAVGNKNYVGAKLDLQATGWNDLLIQVTLPNFEIAKLPNWTFNVNTAVFDLSDVKNSPDVQFPAVYQNNSLFPGGNSSSWKGFYAKEVKVILPPEFNAKNQSKRTEIAAQNLLLDNLGVSGRFYGYNILDKGDATGWQFKVDTLDVTIEANRMKQGKFTGDIKPAALSYIRFKALITPEKYLMTVKVDSADIKMFRGRLVFKQDSWIKMEVDKTTNRFKAEACLNGWLNIAGNKEEDPLGTNPNSKDQFVNFKGIVFQNLRFKSYEQPYIQADYFGYPSEAKLGNFPLSFENIHWVSPTDNIVGIAFKAKLNLMENSGIYADTSLEILGKFTHEEFQSFAFEQIKVDQITLDVEKSGFRLYGQVDFFDKDPIYGKGLRGEIDLTLKPLHIQGKTKILFGTTDFRYWYADFQIDNDDPKSILKIERVEGGLSYHMKRTDGTMAWAYNSAIYQPNASIGLGVRAGAKATFGSGSTFKAKLFLELAYNTSGGLNRAYLLGEGAMMAKDGQIEGSLGHTWAQYDNLFAGAEKEELNSYLAQGNLLKITQRAHPISEVAQDGKVGVFVSIEKDFEHDTFDGLFELYLNLEGLKGAGEHHKFGMAHLYSSPTKSYLHIGTPLDKLGAVFKIGTYDVKVQAYFMTGNVLPTQMIPDARIVQILGSDIINDNRDLSLLENGKGFAFGLNFAVALNYDAGFLYAFVEAGGGFDIMHRKLDGVSCAGRSGLVGNDGWYSMGEVYAYLYGEFGIRIKVLGFKKRVPILQAGVAVLLRGEFPNPTHMEGYVGASYSVLGGLVSGRLRFKVEMGEKCDFVGMNEAIGIAVISDIKPEAGTTVDVFKIPQVAFNYPVDQPFTIEDPEGNPKTVRIKLKTFTLQSNGQDIRGTLEWKDNNTKLNFNSEDTLPPLSDITGTVEVTFEERVNNTWVIMAENGQESKEAKTIAFKTTTAPDYIPMENIKYAYPVPNTTNFYPEQGQTAYIKLKKGQDYLFTGNNAQWIIKGEIYKNNQRQSQTPLVYDGTANKLSFGYTNLHTQKKYKLNLIAYAPGVDPTTIANANTNYNSNTATSDLNKDYTNTTTENKATVNNAQATSNNKANVAKSLLNFDFSSSKHATFTAKINSLNRTGSIFEIIYADTHALHYLTAPYEVFNEAELYGNQYTDGVPLIKVEAVLDDAYYTQQIYPLIYQNYPLDGSITVTNRTPTVLGVPPVKSIDIPGYYQLYLQNNPSSSYVNERLPFRYSMPNAYKSDFADLQYTAVNKYLTAPINWEKYNQYRYLINGTFPVIPIGNYKIKITYSLNENEFSHTAERMYNRNY